MIIKLSGTPEPPKHSVQTFPVFRTSSNTPFEPFRNSGHLQTRCLNLSETPETSKHTA